MYIIEVIPIQHLPKNVSQLLTYYSKEPLEKGVIVEILVQTKPILAIVASSNPIEKRKNELKSNSFVLKKIKRVITTKPITDKTFWDIAKFISMYYYDDLTRVIKIMLPKNITSLVKYLNKQKIEEQDQQLTINQTTKKLFPDQTYINILETFNSKKSILFAFPTESILNFYLDHFKQIFNQDVFVILNKKVSTKNTNTWYSQLLNNQPKLIFGLRKTIGFPINNVDLTYIFSSNDESYKSWDLRPYFNFETVLHWLSKKQKTKIFFQKNQLDLSAINNFIDIKTFDTITKPTNPKTEIIVNQTYNKKDILGHSITKDIFKNINENSKWIILLNKKGFWNGVECKDCKTMLKCENCDKPLTYFKTPKENYLKCSLCNKKTKVITTCPNCKSTNFQPTSLGIDKLEQNILQIVKEKQIPIFNINSDIDEETIEQTIDTFVSSKNGILITTSSITNYILPNIDNVAVINIDNLFSIPDYKTEEKILTILLKLKNLATKNLYIKTSYNNNNIFNTIKTNNFQKFWESEYQLRKKYVFPPFGQLITVEYRDQNPNKAQTEIQIYYDKIKRTIEKNNLNNKFLISQPTPNFHEKINNQYYWSFKIKLKLEEPFIIKPQDIKMRNQLLNILTNDFYIDIDPIN